MDRLIPRSLPFSGERAGKEFRRCEPAAGRLSISPSRELGILAIMLMAIKERTKEIGLRRAVGASRKDILVQFLLEASVLSVGGGFVGIGTGLAGSLVTGAATPLETSVSPTSIVISFTFSIAVGLFFGVYPARKASRLDPITALRTE